MEARFLSKVDKNGDNGCWLWTANSIYSGYGMFKIGQQNQLAHRVSYELYVCKIPEGLCVLHSCDNRACVNPEHLSVGTHEQNMKERNERGRQAKGKDSGRAKLTEQDVREIRILGVFGFSFTELGRMYGVHHGPISSILRNKHWTHVV